MTKHVIRIGPWWLRVPLLILLFPSFYLGWVWALLNKPAGEPTEGEHAFSVMDQVFWPIEVWFAACAGAFVPVDDRR